MAPFYLYRNLTPERIAEVEEALQPKR